VELSETGHDYFLTHLEDHFAKGWVHLCEL
jgi:hypothetical protein